MKPSAKLGVTFFIYQPDNFDYVLAQ